MFQKLRFQLVLSYTQSKSSLAALINIFGLNIWSYESMIHFQNSLLCRLGIEADFVLCGSIKLCLFCTFWGVDERNQEKRRMFSSNSQNPWGYNREYELRECLIHLPNSGLVVTCIESEVEASGEFRALNWESDLFK